MRSLRYWVQWRYRRLSLGIACALLVLLLPSPLSRGYAEFWARAAVHLSNVGTVDGCGFNCDGCGATAMQKTILGYDVRLEYACGRTMTQNTTRCAASLCRSLGLSMVGRRQ